MSIIGVLDLVVVTTAAIATGWGVAMRRKAVGLGGAALNSVRRTVLAQRNL